MDEDGSLVILQRESESDTTCVNDENLSFTHLDFGDYNPEVQGQAKGLDTRDEIALAEILMTERQNLELLKKSNENIRKLISGGFLQSGSESNARGASILTSTVQQNVGANTNDFIPENFFRNDHVPAIDCTLADIATKFNSNRFETSEQNDVNGCNSGNVPLPACQTEFRRLSSRLRHRLCPTKRAEYFTRRILMQACMGAASRYIILASIASFVSAFVLLSWYSSQTHQHNIELAKFTDNRVVEQQSLIEQTQARNINFRETLIHRQYEDARECQVKLLTSHTKNENLHEQITKLEHTVSEKELSCQKELHHYHHEIKQLRDQVRMLREAYQDLKVEATTSLYTSLFHRISGLLSILKNKTVQIGISAFLVVGISLLLLTLPMLSK